MLEILLKTDISTKDAMLLSRMLDETWHQGIGAAAIEQRLSSENPFFISYDLATIEDVNYAKTLGISYEIGERIPIGFLETVVFDFVDYKEIGKNGFGRYEEITQKDFLWKKAAKSKKSLLLTDITLIKSRYGKETYFGDLNEDNRKTYREIMSFWINQKNPKKITAADIMIEYAIDYAKKSSIENLWTLTPWHERWCRHSVRMHEEHLGKRTNHIIKGCRPFFYVAEKGNPERKHRVMNAMIVSYFKRI